MKDDHLVKLFDWLIDEVISASGDGDAFVLNSTYDYDTLKDSALAALGNHRISKWWRIEESEKNECFSLGDDQEWLTVYYKYDPHSHVPTWAQCIVKL